MSYQQKDYFIYSRDNEYYQILSIIEHGLEKAHASGSYPVWGESLDKLKSLLEENQGENITPWEFNMIIKVLLDYVPEKIRDLPEE
ncbi:hypothetical protein B9G55_01370 [Saccharibacillus sp. O16]|nr:hypothetical protein B9G55_01370 [Saccharibacillus sp. O16]